jgi:tRNA(Ile)-lysidine synthase
VITARVRRTIHERALFAPGARVLVACSGGPDSAAMLHALHRICEHELCAASVNHGLRADAAHDVEVAAELARSLAVPFTALRVEVPREGASVMAKARRARYAALIAHARDIGASAIAVGHTRDDQAETVIARAIRGGGALGLAGIDPKRADGVVRPLIDCARAEVHAHVAHHALPFVRDAANTDRAYLRARVREDLLPRLIAEDPRAIEHLAALADDARALRVWVEEAAADLLSRAAIGHDLDALMLRVAPAPVRARALARWIEARTGAGAHRAHIEALERTLDGRGEALLPRGSIARIEGKILHLGLPSGSPGVRSTEGRES